MSIADLTAQRGETGQLVLATRAPTSGDVVTGDPSTLAGQAGVDVEVYSLARLAASEGYDDPRSSDESRTVAAVLECQAVLNKARARGVTVTAHLLRAVWSGGARAPGDGHYGRQGSKSAGYRDASTFNDPSYWHLAVAQAVIDGTVPDLAAGATDFLDPHLMGGVQNGIALESTRAVAQRWADQDQLAWIGDVPGLDPYWFAAFRKEGDADMRRLQVDALLAAIGPDHAVADGAPDDAGSPAGPLLLALLAFAVLASG